ncbi:MAG: hypothetical protein AB7U73_12380 [Pirellulales bacterium]
MISESIVVVTRETRLQGLRQRWATASQAKFYLRQARAHEVVRRQAAPAARRAAASQQFQEADFSTYEREDRRYQEVVQSLERELDFGLPVKFIDRTLLPTYVFWSVVAVVVVGQDGLVANTAKYVGDIPIVGVNPDASRFDGILLPFTLESVRSAVGAVLERRYRARDVTMAEVNLSDGQRLSAFNDFFIGSRTHTSARYTLEVNGRSEPQSSSGVLVATGAGSTGWLSSVFNMAAGVAAFLGAEITERPRLDWEDRRLLWAVREPFVSKQSSASLVAGLLDAGNELVVESLMPSGGVIFSDGIEADALAFESGTTARIAVAKQPCRLVVR